MAENNGAIPDYVNFPHSFEGLELDALFQHHKRLNDLFVAECRKAINSSEQLDRATRRFCSFGRLLAHVFSGNMELPKEDAALQFSITLGSSMEYALQLFLMVFEDDYQKTEWMAWNSFNSEAVLNEFKLFLESLEGKDLLTASQRKKMTKDVRALIAKRESNPCIDILTLGGLSDLFSSRDILGDNADGLYELLVTIRDGRNCVHAFASAKENNFDSAKKLLAGYCAIVNELLFRIHAKNTGGIDYMAMIKAEAAKREGVVETLSLSGDFEAIIVS